MPNGYQKAKAKKIAGVLVRAAAASTIAMSQLPELAARMTADQWRTVSFQAGVPVADRSAKVLVIALLLGMK